MLGGIYYKRKIKNIDIICRINYSITVFYNCKIAILIANYKAALMDFKVIQNFLSRFLLCNKKNVIPICNKIGAQHILDENFFLTNNILSERFLYPVKSILFSLKINNFCFKISRNF